VFAGRIEKIKGLHILMESLAYVDVPVHLAIIGATWDADYAKHIEDQSEIINEKGFHKVMFLGNLDQHDLVPWYQRAAVVVCPFLYETYSNVIRESLACGTPVISTGSHLVENGSDGIVLASKDPKDIARRLNKLLKERGERLRLGREGRRIIEQHFSWESIVKSLSKVYETMLAN
jgi:glycosyltransferase involved in cell wall biosynthesis